LFLSIFDIFKIGIGPSSSHTVGPMVAAGRFLDSLRKADIADLAHVRVSLHGSLAFTGKGHATDRAVVLGLAGERPDRVDPDRIEEILSAIADARSIRVPGLPRFAFEADADIEFDYGPPLPGHANGLRFRAFDAAGDELLARTYYSIGGGFVVCAEAIDDHWPEAPEEKVGDVPYPFATAASMLDMGREAGLSIAEMKRANECISLTPEELDARIDGIWRAMANCIERGLDRRGVLPGGLNVRRRAADIHDKLVAAKGDNRPFEHTVMDWLGVYAMAVNEENAAGGRLVTAPTNGAAGVVPATVRYYLDHCPGGCEQGVRTFFLTAAAIGGIIKHNASISGAEVGCQGEVGSASAMAAAGLCAALGGTNEQIENAAEIALEHHLGMTCDPIGGLVQVPCIERNAFGAVKAVTAASMALQGDGKHFVPLDRCIETMRQTGLDMNENYKETSRGGLAANVVEC